MSDLADQLLRSQLSVPYPKEAKPKENIKPKVGTGDIHTLNKNMKDILKEFEKIFPAYFDTGFQIRDAIPDLNERFVYFLCGHETLVKFTQESKKFQTLHLMGKTLHKLSMGTNGAMLYISTNNKTIIEVDCAYLVKQREIPIDYLNSGIIFYAEHENLLYGITDTCIFSVNLRGDNGKGCKELFQGEFSFFTYRISEWLLAYKNGLIKRIDKNKQEYTIKFQNEAIKVKWSRSRNLVLVLELNNVHLLTPDLEITKTYTLKSQPFHIMMMKDEIHIVVSTEDGYIALINALSDQVLTIPVHRGKIYNFIVDPDFTCITTFGNDSKIGYLKIPPQKLFKAQGCYCSNFFFHESQPEIIYIENNKSLQQWNFETDAKTLLYDKSAVLTPAICYLLLKKTVVFSDSIYILFYSFILNAVEFQIPLTGQVHLTSMRANAENSMLFTLASKNSFIYIYSIDVRLKYGVMKGHSGRITCQVFIPKINYLATGGTDNMILIWDYLSLAKVHTLKGHTQPLTCLTITREGNKILSGSKDCTIKVWYCKTGQLLISMKSHTSPITRMKVDNTNSLISSSTDGVVIYWNLRSYSKIFSTKVKTQINRLAISYNNNQFLAYSNMDKLVVMEFYASSTNLDVIGPDITCKYEYMSYLTKILRGDKVEYEEKWDSWAVIPYQFNTMYFYSYANLYKHIGKCILNKSSLIPSRCTDPYTMVIHKNYQRCLRVYFSLASDLLENNLYSLCFLSGEVLVKLNLQGHNQLHLLYESIFRKHESDDFPKFADSGQLPKYILSDTLVPVNENFFKTEKTVEKVEEINDKKPLQTSFTNRFRSSSEFILDKNFFRMGKSNSIHEMQPEKEKEKEEDPEDDVMDEIQANKKLVPTVLFISAVRMNYTSGSQDSIDLLSSLLRCPNQEVFRTKFIQSLLDMKWKESMKYQVIQAVCYACYLSMLLCYVILFYETVVGIVFLVTLGCLLALYDCYQIYVSVELFLRDIWNYFDILRLLGLLMYVIFYACDHWLKVEIISVIAIISLVRGLSFFRLFNETRYMIQLLICILRDIWSFALLLSYSTLGFCIIFMIQGYEKGQRNFWEFLQHSILLDLAEFHTTQYDRTEWFIFFLAACTNLVIMLNMLIAIMSETFNKVRENSEIANYIQIAGMILETEITFSAHKIVGQKSYFQLCEAESMITKKKDLLSQDIKFIKKMVTAIGKKVGIDIKSKIDQ